MTPYYYTLRAKFITLESSRDNKWDEAHSHSAKGMGRGEMLGLGQPGPRLSEYTVVRGFVDGPSSGMMNWWRLSCLISYLD